PCPEPQSDPRKIQRSKTTSAAGLNPVEPHHHPAPDPANPSVLRNSKARRNFRATANRFRFGRPESKLSADPMSPWAAIQSTPSPATAASQQMRHAALASAKPTSPASRAPLQHEPAPARRTPATAQSSAVHPATRTPREIHSPGHGKPHSLPDAS